jgi:hypothetical protein
MELTRRDLAGLKRAKAKVLGRLRGHPDVTAVGYGLRRRAGQLTDEPAVVVSVRKKRPVGYVSTRRLLPPSVQIGRRTYGVDVHEAGPFTLSAATKASACKLASGQDVNPITEQIRPVPLGCMVANKTTNQAFGTLGCLVRDNTDGSLGWLAAGHSLDSLRGAKVGDVIGQPGDATGDEIGRLARFTTFGSPTSGYLADAAFIKMNAGVAYTTGFARNLMGAVSGTHKILGIHLATGVGGSSLFMRIDNVLKALNVRLESTDYAGTPTIGMSVEKVGFASAYTSSEIVALGTTPVALGDDLFADPTPTTFKFSDLVQVDNGFTWFGDSGAVVAAGGNGQTRLATAGCDLPDPWGTCPLLQTMGTYYDLPLTGDNGLADQLRDQFLSLSRTGRLLNRAVYANFETVIGRLQGTGTSEEQAGALTYYNRYHDFAKRVLDNPNDPSATVTQQHLDDALNALNALHQTKKITDSEYTALKDVHQSTFAPTLYMNHDQVVAYMNQPRVYTRTYGKLAGISTIDMVGPGHGE